MRVNWFHKNNRLSTGYTHRVITEVSVDNYTIRGISVGGIYTSLLVPEIRSMFDVGASPRSFTGAKRLFLSHGHVDHIGALAGFLGIRALSGKKNPLKVFLPEEIEGPLTEALSTLASIQRYPLELDTVPMQPGDIASLGSNLYVRAIRTYHPVPSLGYIFFRRVDKLLPTFSHLSGVEIGQRRKAGEKLFRQQETNELAYVTDTLAKVLDAQPQLYNTKVLIIECTFLDERKSLQATHQGCHIHLDELIERAERFNNNAIVLMHFSQIYRPTDVHRILSERCPENLKNRMIAFAPSSRHWPG